MQAARGTSLTEHEVSEPTPSPRRTSLAVVAALVAYALDQGSKIWAVHALTPGQSHHLVGPLLQLTLLRNPGAAFSAGSSLTPLISVFAIVAAVVTCWYVARVRHPLWALTLGVLLAGIAGNLTDRLFRAPGPLRGHVVDFLQLPHWPVFNLADVCIDVGGVLLVVLLARGIRYDGRPSHPRKQTPGSGS